MVLPDREGGYASEQERWESRQRKRQEAAEQELDVMGDSRIYAIPKQPKRERSQEPLAMRAGSGRNGDGPWTRRFRRKQHERRTSFQAAAGSNHGRDAAFDADIAQQCRAGDHGQPAVREAAAGKNVGNGTSRSDFGHQRGKEKRRRRICHDRGRVYRTGSHFQLCLYGPHDVTDPTLRGFPDQRDQDKRHRDGCGREYEGLLDHRHFRCGCP